MTYPRHAIAPVARWRVHAFHRIPAPLNNKGALLQTDYGCFHPRMAWIYRNESNRHREPVEGGAVSDCGVSAAWARGMPRAGWAGRPTPVLPCAQDSAQEQAAAKPTRTYLRRPRNPTPPRPPTDSPLWTLMLTLMLLWLVAGAGRSPASNPHANSGACRCSSRNNAALVSRPPPKPVNVPLLPITRWQGSTIGNGLRPLAAPTARVAVG